ncbi:uncharacterized protein LOC118165212 isoform X1 [Oxyura jamaicensis]|uniref:uncharacterized protein LOC118165212 isoform X1 n=1 Tax=Oxyura jamaicensis TaxID=8884 RepID=UPI0015A6A3FC|nr:uncharacterized protein LOC118165212 isoform X1 [Oxyura jamaicensis]
MKLWLASAFGCWKSCYQHAGLAALAWLGLLCCYMPLLSVRTRHLQEGQAEVHKNGCLPVHRRRKIVWHCVTGVQTVRRARRFVVRNPRTYSGAAAQVFKLHVHIAQLLKTRSPPDDASQVKKANDHSETLRLHWTTHEMPHKSTRGWYGLQKEKGVQVDGRTSACNLLFGNFPKKQGRAEPISPTFEGPWHLESNTICFVKKGLTTALITVGLAAMLKLFKAALLCSIYPEPAPSALASGSAFRSPFDCWLSWHMCDARHGVFPGQC